MIQAVSPVASRVALSLAMLVIACVDGPAIDDESASTSSTASSSSSSSSSSTGTESESESDGGDPRIVLPATDAALALPFTASILGQGSARVGAIDLVGGVGEVTIDGAVTAIATHERQPWDEFSLTLFQGLAVAPDRWHVLWFYCEGDALTGLYLEGTDGAPLSYEGASGSCNDLAAPSTPQVRFPAVDMAIPSLAPGFVASGPDLGLVDGEAGWVRLGGAPPLIVLPFDRVDCTTECGSPGWWELHAILWDPGLQRACFAIFYFREGDPDVLVTYSLTLPDLSDPAGVTELAAAWTVDGVGP